MKLLDMIGSMITLTIIVFGQGSDNQKRLYELARDNTIKEKIMSEFRAYTLGKRERPTLDEFIAGD